jgi:hypothetical protein
MTTTTEAQTVKIGHVTYTVEHEVDVKSTLTQLGWLHGPRGDLAMVVRTNGGALVAMGSKTLDRVPRDVIRPALESVFGKE